MIDGVRQHMWFVALILVSLGIMSSIHRRCFILHLVFMLRSNNASGLINRSITSGQHSKAQCRPLNSFAYACVQSHWRGCTGEGWSHSMRGSGLCIKMNSKCVLSVSQGSAQCGMPPGLAQCGMSPRDHQQRPNVPDTCVTASPLAASKQRSGFQDEIKMRFVCVAELGLMRHVAGLGSMRHVAERPPAAAERPWHLRRRITACGASLSSPPRGPKATQQLRTQIC